MGGGRGSNRLFRGTKGSQPYINQGQQDKHIPGTNNFKQAVRNGVHKSILTVKPETLLKYVGRGTKVGKNKERVNFRRIIGKFYDQKTGKYIDTRKGLIHHDSKGGVHIVPANPN